MGFKTSAKRLWARMEPSSACCSWRLFRRREGCFGSQCALGMRNMMSALQWWGANECEQEAGELRSVALKVHCRSRTIYGCESCSYVM